jgi:HK97 family phage major capsid protein
MNNVATPAAITQLRQDAKAKHAEFTKLMAGGNDLTSAEIKRAGDLRAELRELKSTLEKAVEKQSADEELKSFFSDPSSPFNFGGAATPDQMALVDGRTGKVEGIKGLTEAQLSAVSTGSYKSAFFQYLARGRDGISMDSLKALSEGADGGGGFLVPEEMQQLLVQKNPTPTRMHSNVRRFVTGRDHLKFPKNLWTSDNVYTSPIRLTQTGEVPASASTAAQTDPTFGEAHIQVYTHMVSGQITKDLLEDNMFDVQQFLVDKYHEAADILMDQRILTGTGVGQVTGILANPNGTIGGQKQPATVSLGDPITGDGIINLAYTLPEQYEGNTNFVLNKVDVLRFISTLKDGNSRYLFASGQYGDAGIASARPKELVGYPFILSGLMPNRGTNNYPIIFGDLSGYYFVERAGMTIQVLDQTQAKLNQIELVGRIRFGGQTVEDWKILVGQQA